MGVRADVLLVSSLSLLTCLRRSSSFFTDYLLVILLSLAVFGYTGTLVLLN